jgi:large subunit ribosomal protein L35
MQKTRKSISKRFKVTGSGKVLYRAPGKRHMMRNRSAKSLRRKGQDHVASDGVKRFVQIGAPILFK